MKILAGIVLAGAVAAGVAGVAVTSGGGGGPLAAEKPKFPIPVWHPDARWEKEGAPYMGSGVEGHLDGARRGIMWARAMGTGRCFPGAESGPYGCYSYDPKLERLHTIAGSARGLLDGPFARARFGGWGYASSYKCTASPDGRYFFMIEPLLDRALRRLDLKEQMVKTVPIDTRRAVGIKADSQGRLLLITKDGNLQYLDENGKVVETKKLEIVEKAGFRAYSLTLDEDRGRLFATTFGAKKWYVWYWDMKDGSFHGVLPIAQKGEPRRKCAAMRPTMGPFKGTVLYNQMGNFLGPDDPERKFLYIQPNDTGNFFRLDLEKEMMWGPKLEGKQVRFVDSGSPGKIGDFAGWLEDGSFSVSTRPWVGARIFRFRRVK